MDGNYTGPPAPGQKRTPVPGVDFPDCSVEERFKLVGYPTARFVGREQILELMAKEERAARILCENWTPPGQFNTVLS